MTLEEISSLIAQRLLQGSMNHQQFSNYYNFLGLEGYKLAHTYHFYEQMFNYQDFVTYFTEHYNKLIPKFGIESFSSISIVPNNWYEYKREDVDINTRRSAVKTGLERYVYWERDTKKFFEDMYMQATGIGEVGLALKIQQCIECVDKEIKHAEKQLLEIKSTDYDLPTIISKQDFLIKKYTKKIKELRKGSKDDKSQRS